MTFLLLVRVVCLFPVPRASRSLYSVKNRRQWFFPGSKLTVYRMSITSTKRFPLQLKAGLVFFRARNSNISFNREDGGGCCSVCSPGVWLQPFSCKSIHHWALIGWMIVSLLKSFYCFEQEIKVFLWPQIEKCWKGEEEDIFFYLFKRTISGWKSSDFF